MTKNTNSSNGRVADQIGAWDNPEGLGWRLWSRAKHTALLPEHRDGYLNLSCSLVFRDFTPLATAVRRRWEGNQGSIFGPFGPDMPLIRPFRAPSFFLFSITMLKRSLREYFSVIKTAARFYIINQLVFHEVMRTLVESKSPEHSGSGVLSFPPNYKPAHLFVIRPYPQIIKSQMTRTVHMASPSISLYFEPLPDFTGMRAMQSPSTLFRTLFELRYLQQHYYLASHTPLVRHEHSSYSHVEQGFSMALTETMMPSVHAVRSKQNEPSRARTSSYGVSGPGDGFAPGICCDSKRHSLPFTGAAGTPIAVETSVGSFPALQPHIGNVIHIGLPCDSETLTGCRKEVSPYPPEKAHLKVSSSWADGVVNSLYKRATTIVNVYPETESFAWVQKDRKFVTGRRYGQIPAATDVRLMRELSKGAISEWILFSKRMTIHCEPPYPLEFYNNTRDPSESEIRRRVPLSSLLATGYDEGKRLLSLASDLPSSFKTSAMNVQTPWRQAKSLYLFDAWRRVTQNVNMRDSHFGGINALSPTDLQVSLWLRSGQQTAKRIPSAASESLNVFCITKDSREDSGIQDIHTSSLGSGGISLPASDFSREIGPMRLFYSKKTRAREQWGLCPASTIPFSSHRVSINMAFPTKGFVQDWSIMVPGNFMARRFELGPHFLHTSGLDSPLSLANVVASGQKHEDYAQPAVGLSALEHSVGYSSSRHRIITHSAMLVKDKYETSPTLFTYRTHHALGSRSVNLDRVTKRDAGRIGSSGGENMPLSFGVAAASNMILSGTDFLTSKSTFVSLHQAQASTIQLGFLLPAGPIQSTNAKVVSSVWRDAAHDMPLAYHRTMQGRGEWPTHHEMANQLIQANQASTGIVRISGDRINASGVTDTTSNSEWPATQGNSQSIGSLDEIADKIWKKIMRKTMTENERRGCSRWLSWNF